MLPAVRSSQYVLSQLVMTVIIEEMMLLLLFPNNTTDINFSSPKTANPLPGVVVVSIDSCEDIEDIKIRVVLVSGLSSLLSGNVIEM